MIIKTAYRGHSGLSASSGTKGSRILRLAPDLDRDSVRFDAALKWPLRFREGMSSLHDVVISDLRFQKRDKSAYQAWKKGEQGREASLRGDALRQAKAEHEARTGVVITPEMESEYNGAKARYWKARRGLNDYLIRNDPELWRQLMPYDPVMTVAPDSLFFECFSADESTYGCLSVEREGTFTGIDTGISLGTTNVDYSWNLYDHFQGLRSYRATRFSIDPDGFELRVGEAPEYREEKIDVPDGWLRGFAQIQSAMTMPMRRVRLDVSTVYSLLAFMRRNKAKESPRAIRFELTHGKSPVLVLEPFEQRIESPGTVYEGPDALGENSVRLWGRRRLSVLARALPLADSVDVYLLGTGLPSFWVVRMGEMTLTVGLSGWTTNDWSHGSALDQLQPSVPLLDGDVAKVAKRLQSARSLDLQGVVAGGGLSKAIAFAALGNLALRGQAIYDLTQGVYRWRQLMPMVLSDKELGDSNPEAQGAREILASGKERVESSHELADGSLIITGTVAGKPAEVRLDAEGIIQKGKCVCGHHFRFGIRNGPCRHLQVLRDLQRGLGEPRKESMDQWFARRMAWLNK